MHTGMDAERKSILRYHLHWRELSSPPAVEGVGELPERPSLQNTHYKVAFKRWHSRRFWEDWGKLGFNYLGLVHKKC